MSAGAPGLLEAGKYGAYVWPAYGVSAVVLAGAAVESVLRARRWRRRVRALEAERAAARPDQGAGA